MTSRTDWDKMRELAEDLKRIAQKHDVTIEMPTHDHMTITGRILRPDDIDFHDFPPRTQLGRDLRAVVVKSKKMGIGDTPIFNIDFEQLELRILASWANAKEEPMPEEGTEVQCVDCPKKFIVSPGEEKSLRKRFGDDFAMPKRCKPCRLVNKERKENKRGSTGHPSQRGQQEEQARRRRTPGKIGAEAHQQNKPANPVHPEKRER
jgi:hypothetical protein